MNDFIYFYPVNVYFGDKAASKALPSTFIQMGINMYFDGDADESKISQVPVKTILKQEEIIDMVRACMR